MTALTTIILAVVLLFQSESSAQSYSFRGELNEQSVDKIIEDLRAGQYATIAISSEGGRDADAVRLGRFIHRNGIGVEAVGYCLSACALYILPASTNTIVQPDTVVAFHVSTASTYIAAELNPDLRDHIPVSLLEVYESVTSYYEEVGIDLALLRHSLIAHDILCVGYTDEFGSGAYVNVSREWWIPARQYLNQLGYNLSGSWLEPAAFLEILEAVNDERSTVVVDGTHEQFEQLWTAQEHIAECTQFYD